MCGFQVAVQRAMVVSRREAAEQAPQRLITSVAGVLGTLGQTPRGHTHSLGKSRPQDGDGRGLWNASGKGALTGGGTSGSMNSLTGATHVSAAASSALQDTGTAQDVVKALARAKRHLVRLMRRYHRKLCMALEEVRGSRRMLRRAQRVALAESRAPPRHWVARMVQHCETVARCGPLRCVHVVSVSCGLL